MLVGILLRKLTKKPKFFNDIANTLDTVVEIDGIIEVDEKLIKDICDYCEKESCL